MEWTPPELYASAALRLLYPGPRSWNAQTRRTFTDRTTRNGGGSARSTRSLGRRPIPDINAAMTEIVSVLKLGGALHFVEHGRSADPKVAARQRRFEPIQKRIRGGCHLTRDPAALAERAGLEVEQVDRFVLQRPKILTTMSCGRAVRA